MALPAAEYGDVDAKLFITPPVTAPAAYGRRLLHFTDINSP
jgi:hypothetical protein